MSAFGSRAETLKDTTLFSIVRDEEQNPAGGIVKFVNAHAPYVEAMYVADTGSQDNTRALLKELKKKHPNLVVFDHPFDGFANSLNFLLEKVKTKYVLRLDADELIREKKFDKLKELIEKYSATGYNFQYTNVYPDGTYENHGYVPKNPLLFEASKDAHYRYEVYEILFLGNMPLFNMQGMSFDTGIEVLHFCPPKEALEKKKNELYEPIITNEVFKISPVQIFAPPSTRPNFNLWKQYNPQRDLYA